VHWRLTSLTVDSHELRFDEAFLIHAGEVPAFVPQTDASGDLPVPAVSDFLDLSETRQRRRDHENQPWGIEVRDKALPDFLKGDMGEREYDALMRLEAGARLGGAACIAAVTAIRRCTTTVAKPSAMPSGAARPSRPDSSAASSSQRRLPRLRTPAWL
jgi:hypothetical protein